MRKTLSIGIVCLVAGAWAAVAPESQLNQGQEPPQEVAQEIRALLQPAGVVVSLPDGQKGHFWFVSEFAANQADSREFGVNFGTIKVGTFFGVVKWERDWIDYKKKPVPAGVYTLRYGVQPADGNHTGVSLYRDFLLLIPTDDDSRPEAELAQAELNQLSNRASGTNHPAVMAVFPLFDPISQARLEQNEMDQLTLMTKIGEVSLGLVVSGHGEVEGD